MAAIEVPRSEWPELIAALLANMAAPASARELRQSTLETLGYTCEELGSLDEDYLSQQEVNSILTAVVQVRACVGLVGAGGCWSFGGWVVQRQRVNCLWYALGSAIFVLRSCCAACTAPVAAPALMLDAALLPPLLGAATAVQGMRKEEPEAEVRHAATVALQNALTFAHNNFSNDSERNYIMQIICEGTLAGGCCRVRRCRRPLPSWAVLKLRLVVFQLPPTHPLIHSRTRPPPLCLPPAESSRIRQASWECLACIASGYYDKLPAYMQDVFSLTQQTVGRDEEEVVLQALEFWCTVAEEETEREGVSPAGSSAGLLACCAVACLRHTAQAGC